MAAIADQTVRGGEVRDALLDATRQCLLETGYAQLSTRRITERAGVALSQLHYHFGSKHGLVLALLARENARLLERQRAMYEDTRPLWKQWEQACDYLEEDLESGYVRVLQEMAAAGWSNEEIAAAVRDDLRGWFRLLTSVIEKLLADFGPLGGFRAKEIATLVGLAFLGAESMILLGIAESEMPCRAALRRVGDLIRALETAGT
ncbi:MAG TPA: TetR/AcrR family transcriptional regulator [Woeseiaceae bacterium]|jgi:AcrR family transcriptional regulator